LKENLRVNLSLNELETQEKLIKVVSLINEKTENKVLKEKLLLVTQSVDKSFVDKARNSGVELEKINMEKRPGRMSVDSKTMI